MSALYPVPFMKLDIYKKVFPVKVTMLSYKVVKINVECDAHMTLRLFPSGIYLLLSKPCIRFDPRHFGDTSMTSHTPIILSRPVFSRSHLFRLFACKVYTAVRKFVTVFYEKKLMEKEELKHIHIYI